MLDIISVSGIAVLPDADYNIKGWLNPSPTRAPEGRGCAGEHMKGFNHLIFYLWGDAMAEVITIISLLAVVLMIILILLSWKG